VSTVGLGLHYNEDLMLQLARASDGNHAFARDPSELIAIFNKEFDDVLGSCAQTVSIDIELKPGMRVVRALSRDGAIDGAKAQFKLAQIYAATEHYVLVEVELDKALATGEQELGVVKIAYTAADGGERRTLDAPIQGRFSTSEKEVDASIDLKVSASVVEQITRGRAQEAVLLRDRGRHDEARRLFEQNSADLNKLFAVMPAATAPNPRLEELKQQYDALGAASASAADPGKMNLERKMLRALDATRAGAATRY
jgi:Ca-activated chloride channel family protein